MNPLNDAELAEALKSARIPVDFHLKKLTLKAYKEPGEALAEWVIMHAAADLATGNGKFIVGNSPDANKCFFTLARSLVIRGFSVKVFSLPMFARLLGTPELAEEISDISALMIAGFFEAKFAKAFSEETLYELEWFFRSRWNNHTANIFLSSHPIANCSWWSDGFLEAVAMQNSEVTISAPKLTARPRHRPGVRA